MATLENKEVIARVVGKGVGGINESDVMMAASCGATIYGFSIDMPIGVKKLASREGVPIRIYNVIYELLDDIKEKMSELLAPEVVETEVAKLVIKGVILTNRNQVICCGEVTKGKIVTGLTAVITRDKKPISEAVVTKVQRLQSEVKEVVEGDMCGLELKVDNKVDVHEGDRVEFVKREVVKRSL